jgi:hypothetical protein
MESYLEVPRALDLSYARAAQLAISGHSFPPSGDEDNRDRKAEDHGIVLAHATLRQVIFPHIETSGGKKRPLGGCPVPLDLTAVSVTDWEVGKADTPVRKRYKTLLQQTRPFRRDNYRKIEHICATKAMTVRRTGFIGK